MAMHDVIVRLAPGLEGLIFDLYTSRADLTDLGLPASITYVRFPYYLGTSVVTLCDDLNMARLGQYALTASWQTLGLNVRPMASEQTVSSQFVGIDNDAWAFAMG